MRLVRFVLPIVLIGVLSTPALAQTVTGTVQGTVTDPTGAVLPGVTVIFRNLETGVARELTTNEVGFYSAPYLAVGGIPSRPGSPASARSSATKSR